MSDNEHKQINWRSRIVKYGKIHASELCPHPDNPRTHPQLQRDAVAASFNELGQIAPILININNGYIVDGVERSWLALAQPGDVEVDAIWLDLTEAEHQRALLIFDPITSLATYDTEKLDALLRDVNTDSPALQSMLSQLAENNGLYFGEQPPTKEDPGAQIDRAEELQQKWQVKRGDLWEIGKHRLLCGDSTNADDVARVMAREKADCVFNDPPYGMNLDTDFDSMFTNDVSHHNTGHRFNPVIGDNLDYDPRPLMELLKDIPEQFWWGADYYADKIPGLTSGVFIVWDKRCSEEMDKVVGNIYEMAWSKNRHRKEIARVLWSGHHGMQRDDTKQRVHPTQKPVELAKWFLGRYTDLSDDVLDCYGGSGTTMVACEQLNRQCRMIEISEKYCAVILERMSDMGLEPQLVTL